LAGAEKGGGAGGKRKRKEVMKTLSPWKKPYSYESEKPSRLTPEAETQEKINRPFERQEKRGLLPAELEKTPAHSSGKSN